MKYAGFFKRLVAYTLDVIVFYIPFGMVFGWGEYSSSEWFLHLVLWTAYVVWMTGMYGATIGKMIMKIKVVKENGKKVSYSDVLVRELVSNLSAVVLFIGYLNVLWDAKQQSWHDKIAKTVVVQA